MDSGCPCEYYRLAPMKIHLLSNSARKDGQNWRCGAGSRNTIGRPSPNRNTHKCLGTCSSRGHSEDSRTADFYRKHAREYFDSTARLSLEPLYQPFIRRLPQRANVLDAGCGSGRDTKAFKEKGFRVECIDASPELARMATHLTGQTCRVMSFQNITFR